MMCTKIYFFHGIHRISASSNHVIVSGRPTAGKRAKPIFFCIITVNCFLIEAVVCSEHMVFGETVGGHRYQIDETRTKSKRILRLLVFFYIVCDRKIFCAILFRRTASAAENNSKVWLINAQNTEFGRFEAEIRTI